MRELREYAVRRSGTRSPLRKVFLAFEGEKTESIYFSALKQQSAQCRLSQLVELVPLEKEGREYGMSNPVRVLECLTTFMEECKEGKITWKSLIRKLHAETGCQVSEEEIHDLLLQSEMPGSDSQMDSGYIEDVDSAVSQLLKSLDENQEQLKNAILNFEFDPPTMDWKTDHIYMIVDRDRHSFKENQYDEVLTKCNTLNIRFCPTNPCFELWLLLHFRKLNEAELDNILENRKVKNQEMGGKRAKKTYTEFILCQHLPGYKKKHVNTNLLLSKLDNALANASGLPEDPLLLKNQVGSAVPRLIRDLRDAEKDSHTG
ncbi:RloB family protein [Faecalibaculum rodentium]|uniref:RloB family protein n=1 Tax=Faecalibaculum rodentium TaxID=1702221 RepID=UPI0023F20877|nr:RloB family protein [Faecalibaculum rodentium]